MLLQENVERHILATCNFTKKIQLYEATKRLDWTLNIWISDQNLPCSMVSFWEGVKRYEIRFGAEGEEEWKKVRYNFAAGDRYYKRRR